MDNKESEKELPIVKSCSAATFCKLSKQDGLSLSTQIDDEYHRVELPGKLRISISGCPKQCADTPPADIALTGRENGWTVTVAGRELATDIQTDAAPVLVGGIMEYYRDNAGSGETIARLIERIGIDALCRIVSPLIAEESKSNCESSDRVDDE